ncbi:hypothetical protein TWF788_006344 [Orbilia oligospora]|uniref:Uncharacterized protein n=1 Tax=Orbilia oligospora TaxID=2813651 RepID=A0A7C8TY58_ORBOL|nr:hypothetical protein TWF788_006344 [Orbilia oligospora]
MISSCFIHSLVFALVVAPLGQFFALAADSAFYGKALRNLRANENITTSLRTLKPWAGLDNEILNKVLSTFDPNPASVDRLPCSRRVRATEENIQSLEEFGLFRDPPGGLKNDFKKYKRGSSCTRRDMLLALMLDAFTTDLRSLRTFWEYQLFPDDETEHVCREVGTGSQILQAIGSALSGNGAVSDTHTCKNELVGKPVSMEDYTKEIENLRLSMVTMYDVVDGWVCKHKMTDRSMTYFTLFTRGISDSRIALHQNDLENWNLIRVHENGPENPNLVTVHFLEDYPKASTHSLELGLTKFTKDIGPTATNLINDLKLRAEFTKNLMKTFGKKDKTQEETENITKYCGTLKDVVPNDKLLPAKNKPKNKPENAPKSKTESKPESKPNPSPSESETKLGPSEPEVKPNTP